MKVLVIGNDRNYVSFLSKKLTEVSMEIKDCESLADASVLLEKEVFEVVICCLPLLRKSCPLELMDDLNKCVGNAAIVIISDNIQLHVAMDLMRQGVYTCFNRPFPLEQLTRVLAEIAERREDKQAPETIRGAKPPEIMKQEPEKIVLSKKRYVRGISKVANKMYSQIDLVGPTSFSVIVYGETGTGKEAVAHRVATAKSTTAPYIAVDCGCLTKDLALSELFGHEKGSFTGAVSKKIGAFELANKGTLFLDEIGNLDYEVQGFLLRAIQERKIRRVGGTEDVVTLVRIVVASNENLAAAVKSGKFREDLYHRLNEFEITVPPLRSRPEDLPLFIEQFVAEANIELGKAVCMPDEDAMDALQHYNWPGNIRELKNVIRRACLFCPDQSPINADCLPEEVLNYMNNEPEEMEENNAAPVLSRMKRAGAITVDDIEEALKLSNYNKTQAAHYLGIDRKTLYNKLKRLNGDN